MKSKSFALMLIGGLAAAAIYLFYKRPGNSSKSPVHKKLKKGRGKVVRKITHKAKEMAV